MKKSKQLKSLKFFQNFQGLYKSIVLLFFEQILMVKVGLSLQLCANCCRGADLSLTQRYLQETKNTAQWGQNSLINYRFLVTETNIKYISLFIHNFISKAICTEYTDFCLQLCFSEKEKTTLTKLAKSYE